MAQSAHQPRRAAARRALLLAAAAIPITFLGLLFFAPLAAILRLGLSPAGLAEALGDPYYRQVAWFSAWQAILSTAITLLLGLPAAFVFARLEFRGRALLRALALLPFVLPTVVVAAGFSALLGAGGPIAAIAGLLGQRPPQVAGTLGAVVLAHAFYNIGLVVRLVGGLWGAVDPRLGQAAATMGVAGLAAFRRITLPLILPGVAAAALLTFIFCFGSFGVVLLLGGPRMATLEVEIYRQTTQRLNLDVAASLALLQLVATLLAGWGYRWLAGRQVGRADLRARREARRQPRGPGERALLGGVVAGVLLMTAPLAALAWRSLTLPLAPRLPAELTLGYYALLGQNQRGSLFFVPPLQAIGNSLGFALAATALALAVGGVAALVIAQGARRGGGRLPRLLDIACTLPLGVSAVMLGLGYLVAWGPSGALRSPLLIPAVHALLAFPFVVRTLVPALQGRSRRLPEAARMLGARPRRVLLAIELPLLAPAMLSAAIFAFTASLGEFGAALLLSRPEYPTIPLVIARLLGQPGASNYGQALALSTILMLISLAGFLLIERIRPEGIGEV